MVETRVRKLSDGEELVVEESTAGSLVDPRERTLETRKRALGDNMLSDQQTKQKAGRQMRSRETFQ